MEADLAGLGAIHFYFVCSCLIVPIVVSIVFLLALA